MTRSRLVRLGLGALALGIALVLVSAVLFTRGSSGPGSTPTGRGGVLAASEVSTSGDVTDSITALQSRLRRLPSDSESWAALGSAYVQQARVSGDPSYYQQAEGAFRRSLRESPVDNAAALTGQAALAAARHEFVTALRLARSALHINAFSSATMAVLVDALIELGRYDAAFTALQRMVDLKPAVPSYTRVSYSYELRGDIDGARFAMQQALHVAYSGDDKAFALYQLGELAWNDGDPQQAARLYAKGLRADPSYVPNRYGIAKTEAAIGNTPKALATYEEVIARLPQPQYLIEYADLLISLGKTQEAAAQHALVDAQEQILRASGVNLDLELALYDASRGRLKAALEEARSAWVERKSVFVEDALAWALHVNGRDRAALPHAVGAQRLGTRSALFAFHRGMIERSLGMQRAAERSLQRALDLNPHFSPTFALHARQALNELRQGGG